jgi:XTP/dITP diphosphohydrolase
VVDRIFAATRNAGKLRELRELFAVGGLVLEAYDGYGDVEETADSYEGNAVLKAVALRTRLRADRVVAGVVGDDSGLEVAALGGRPGVLSARYGGPGATWLQRRRLLLDELEATGSADRSARFVCALAYIGPGAGPAEAPLVVERDFGGAIAEGERGAAGFSYDSLFVDLATGKTFAEIDEHTKNRISHRGRAVAALLAILRDPGLRCRDVS